MFHRTMKCVRKNTSEQFHNFPNEDYPDQPWQPSYGQLQSRSYTDVTFIRWDKERNIHLAYGTDIISFMMDDDEAKEYVLGGVYELDLGV